MKALVVGGAGFIGSRIAKELYHLGYDVAVCDNLVGSSLKNIPSGIQFYSADVTSSNSMRSVFSSFSPDVVILSVSYFYGRDAIYKFYDDNELTLLSANVISSLLEKYICHFYFFSTSEVYGKRHVSGPVKEDKKIVQSATQQGVAKLSAERLLEFRCSELGIPYTVFRPFEVYGPRVFFTPRTDMISFMAEAFLMGEAIGVVNAARRCDFIHIDDAIFAIMAFIKAEASGVFNIGSGKGIQLRKIYKKLLSLVPGAHRPCEIKGKGIDFSLVADMSSFKKVTGKVWRPKHSILDDCFDVVEFRRSCLFPAE